MTNSRIPTEVPTSRRDPYRLVGTTLAEKYRLDEYAGGGGMGAVYRSRAIHRNQVVAVKILKPDIQDRNANYGPLFEREIKAARLLQHPHIVKVFDSGRTPEDIFYMVMEWLDGQTLEEVVTQESLSLDRVLSIFKQTCDAFDFAHAHKVIHLDIKPANIFLLSDKQPQDFIKIFDFGLSRVISSDSGTTVTRFMGTHQYCSPEHFGGKVSSLSDVYSLGVTLYQLLTGVLPFGNSYVQAKQFPNLPLPPIPLLQKMRSDLPSAINAVIEKAISRKPAERQQSTRELYEELSHAAQGATSKYSGVRPKNLLLSLADTIQDEASSVDEETLSDDLDREPRLRVPSGHRSLFAFQERVIAEAIESTIKAAASTTNRRAGIVWQTQGTGLSTTVTNFLAQIVQQPKLQDYVIVVATDRAEAAHQLWTLFTELFQHLGVTATNVWDNDQLAQALTSRRHKIIFTTTQRLQKLPVEPVSNENTLLVAYDLHGYSNHLASRFSQAVSILFTTTPIRLGSPALSIFGDLIFKYSLEQAINDDFVLPVQIERRIIFPPTDFVDAKDKPGKHSLLDSAEFIERVGRDILQHFEAGDRKGKALIIVPNRTIGEHLHAVISRYYSELHSSIDAAQYVRVISSALNSQHRAILARRYSDPDDPFRLAITSGMWLTGMNTPLLTTIYLLKKMSHHSLLQVVARAARANKDVKAGLLVDYLGLTGML